MKKFTICMPAYNRAYIIRKPLDSLVNQDLKDFEVLVVDDGSTDGTEDVVKEYEGKLNLTYIKKKNGGKHTALNVGLDNAKGELFLILDSDDELLPDALSQMNQLWEENKHDVNICGIMGRCATNGKTIGRPFAQTPGLMSYVAFHYAKGGGHYGDCCECVRTDIINKFRWPENLETRFVPESYVNDLIGLKYKLVTVNTVFEIKEYQENGITLNYKEFIRKNINGILFGAVSKIEDILPYAAPGDMTLWSKIRVWGNYWTYVMTDKAGTGPRVKRVSFLGALGFLYGMTKNFAKWVLRRN